MSLFNVSMIEEFNLPPGVKAAFVRELKMIDNSRSFVDRSRAVADTISNCLAWRFAGQIDRRQLSDLLRFMRRGLERDLGEVTENEAFSAEEVFQSEAESADLMRDLGLPVEA